MTNWRRSTRCETNSCVDVAIDSDRVLMRNSQRPDELVEFDADQWRDFVAGVRAGEFD